MGGAEAGEVASKIVIQTISDALLPQLIALHDRVDNERSEDLLEKIKDAIIIANKEIVAQTEQIPPNPPAPFFKGGCPFPKGGRGDFSGMGSTVTLAAIVGTKAYIGHVGDSRLYLIDKEGIYQKTTDHSIVSRLLQIGAITPEEAETHPQRDVLLKAVGARRDIEPDTFSFALKQGDILLLCSDGLTKHLQDSEIHKIVIDASSPQQACDFLVNHANLCGGEDNITVIMVQIVPCQFDL
jgi:protein phosphatase